MNKQKLLIILILSIFIIGIVLSPASAGHTYKKGGYKFTVSNSLYKKINYCKKNPDSYEYINKNVKVKGPKKTVKYKYYYSGMKWRYVYKKEKCFGYIHNDESGKPVITIKAKQSYYTATAVSKNTWTYRL